MCRDLAKIVLDKNKKDYFLGDIIKGKIIFYLKEKEDLTIKELSLNWFTIGKAFSFVKNVIDINIPLNKIELQEIGTYTYDFEIKIPDDIKLPQTYNGKIIAINWDVTLKIDLKNDKKIKFKEEISEKIAINKRYNNILKYERKFDRIDTLIFTFFIVPILFILFIIIYNLMDNNSIWELLSIIVIIIIMIVNIIRFIYNTFKLTKQIIQKKKLNKIELVNIEDFKENLEFRLKLIALNKIDLDEIIWKLEIEEEAITYGRNNNIFTNKLYTNEIKEKISKVLEAGEEIVLSTNFNLNKNFPNSLKVDGNVIDWNLKIKLNNIDLENYELIVV